jgi:hypothetical protein
MAMDLHTPSGAGVAFLAVLVALLLAPFIVRFAGPKGLI